MKIQSNLSDEAILEEIGQRVTQHRLNRNLSQADLATESGISTRTLQRIEQGKSTQGTNLIRVLRALEMVESLDTVIPPVGPSPMETLQRQGSPRKRASRRKPAESNAEPWSWGDEP